MKKLIACILAVAISLSLCACSSLIEGFQAGFQEGFQDAIENAGAELNKTVSRGTVSDDTYTSTYAELTFKKGASWSFLSEEELSETMNSGADILDQEDFEQAMASMASVYDMMAVDSTTGNNLIVCYENLKLSNSTAITPQRYLEMVEQQLSGQSSITFTAGEKTEVSLCGNTYLRGAYTMTYSGNTMSQYYYVRKLGQHMLGVIVTIADQTDISQIEAMFLPNT